MYDYGCQTPRNGQENTSGGKQIFSTSDGRPFISNFQILGP